MNELTDECLMPLGKHKDKQMQEVPAEYLLWYLTDAKSPNRAVIDYIKDNLQGLKQEANGKR